MDTSDLHKPRVVLALLPTNLLGLALIALGMVIQGVFGEEIPAWLNMVAYVVAFSGPLYILFVIFSVLSESENFLSARALRRVRKALDR